MLFSGVPVIEDFTCNIQSRALGLLGPNGSGKTTLIKLMLGLLQPTSGTIELNIPGEDLRVITDQPNLPEEMTIDQWVETIEELHGPPTRNIDIQTNFGLDGEWKIKNLSAGQKRKAALLLAFYGRPKLIILDEPTNFLDIVSREYILNLLKEHMDYTGAKLLIASHRIEEIRMFCDDVLILKEGQVLATVSLSDQIPQLYAMRVDDEGKMMAELDNEQVFYFLQTTYQGNILKMEASDAVFNAAAKFIIDGGRIFEFEAVDELQRAIEDLLQ
jgi:ABC-2 type transport system ATP-binding protein